MSSVMLTWGAMLIDMIFLDTNIVVAYLNGHESVVSQVVDHIDDIALSTLVIAELDYGAKASQQSDKNLTGLYRFVDLIQVVPFDLSCARVLGTVKIELRKIGKPTGEVDAMIAAVALAHHAELVTHNTRHFEQIENLKIVDWIGS